ncbi:MAG: hypothetical protein ACFCUE_14370 [Candidatus Bathyarchaeia archaeon]
MSNKKAETFDLMLLEAIDETLSTLGESVKKSIYFHLETTYQIQRQQIPCKIMDFSNSLEKMFGLGARFIEISIMKRFYPKIKQSCSGVTPKLVFTDFSFTEYIEFMDKEYHTKRKTEKIEFFIETSNHEIVSERYQK